MGRSILQGQKEPTRKSEFSLLETQLSFFVPIFLIWTIPSSKSTRMSRIGVIALLAMFLIAQALAADEPAKTEGEAEEEPDNPYGRASHTNMEYYRLATVGAFLVVALLLGLVVYKTCSWPRLV